MARTGRPPKDPKADQPTKDLIIAWISDGNTLREFCRQNKISFSAVYQWMDKDSEFAARFARARDIGHDVIAEETIAMIDEAPERIGTQFGDKIDPGHVQWQKNRVEQRLKLLAKWNPKKYGDKVTLSGDDANPLQHKHDVTISPDEAYKRMLGGG